MQLQRPLHHNSAVVGGRRRRSAAWFARGRHSLRNLAYDDKQVTSPAIFNHVCAESCVRTCARAEVNALRAYLNQSESPRTIRFVRRLDDFYKLLRCVVFIGLVGDGGGSPFMAADYGI